jgi:hypothetical protein
MISYIKEVVSNFHIDNFKKPSSRLRSRLEKIFDA